MSALAQDLDPDHFTSAAALASTIETEIFEINVSALEIDLSSVDSRSLEIDHTRDLSRACRALALRIIFTIRNIRSSIIFWIWNIPVLVSASIRICVNPNLRHSAYSAFRTFTFANTRVRKLCKFGGTGMQIRGYCGTLGTPCKGGCTTQHRRQPCRRNRT